MKARPVNGEVWRRKVGDRKPWLVASVVSRGGTERARLVAIDDPREVLKVDVATMLRGYTRCRA
jgi:hypothetical protein